MCGISGYLDLNRGVDSATLRKMTQVINYRGPDDEGYLLMSSHHMELLKGKDTAKDCPIRKDIEVYNGVANGFYLGFGHRRLSIIDVSVEGHQPMVDQEQALAVTFNGEIYNYIELKKELEKKEEVSFSTNSDTEVILWAYKVWGKQCVNHFSGMWSFAIFDMKQRLLFCSRDRLGAKPFYYYRKGNHFVFGSEIKQLCQDADMERRLNEKRLVTTLTMGLQDYSEETLLEDVFSLPAGHNLTVKIDEEGKQIQSFQINKYWDLEIPEIKQRDNNWYQLIEDAICIRMRADVPIGVMVSGGIDSTFILDKSCENKTDKLMTFTSCYRNDNKHDETYYAHLVNESCKVNENLIYPATSDALGAYRNMIWHFEDYAGLSTLGAFLTLKEVAESGVKVILNGQGGDESMLGYERYYAFYLKQVLKSNFWDGVKLAKMITEHSGISMKSLLQYMIYFNFPTIRVLRNKQKMNKILDKSLLKKLPKKEIKELIGCKDFNSLIYNEIKKCQLTHILRMDDRSYMAFSMESRVPFIDYKYLQEVVGIDPMMKIQNGYTKYLLRKKMSRLIPDEVKWRKNKNGWSSPDNLWMQSIDKNQIEKIMENSVADKYFDLHEIKKIWDKNPLDKRIFQFIFTDYFIRMFIQGEPCSESGM